MTDRTGLILTVPTNAANEHDRKAPLDPEGMYSVPTGSLSGQEIQNIKANDECLATCGRQSWIMHKGCRNRPMNAVQSVEIREISLSVGRWSEPLGA